MEGVRKHFGATRALDGVDLDVRAGEVHALVGENGAGKSTLMKVLSGAHAPDAGAMWIAGEPYAPRNPLDARRHGVAMIYQELSLAPHLSVMENILLGIEPGRGGLIRWPEMRRRAQAALDELRLNEVSPATPVGALPVALRQMVEIARAVTLDCRILVLDEPTSSLTRRDIERLFDLIRRLRASGRAVVYISHFLEEVREVCDRYTVLRDGRTVGTGRVEESTDPQLVGLMVGRNVEELYPRHARRTGDVALEVTDLAGATKPCAASLELRRGEIVGIAGLVGAGRTEFLRVLFGLEPVRSGRVRVGAFSGGRSPAQSWRAGVGLVSEDRKNEGLAQGLSIAENITLARLDGLGPWRWVRPSRQRAASEPWIRRLGIRCRNAAQPVQALSGGNQQKVALARLLHAEVDVLLLDEPTRGIDVGAKAEIYRIMDELAAGDPAAGRAPRAVLMVSSYLPELLGVCDRIAVMSRGRLGPARPVAEWDERRLMEAAIGREEKTV